MISGSQELNAAGLDVKPPIFLERNCIPVQEQKCNQSEIDAKFSCENLKDSLCTCIKGKSDECKICRASTPTAPVEHSRSTCTSVEVLKSFIKSEPDVENPLFGKSSDGENPTFEICTKSESHECKMYEKFTQGGPVIEHSWSICSLVETEKFIKSESDMKFSDGNLCFDNLCTGVGSESHECKKTAQTIPFEHSQIVCPLLKGGKVNKSENDVKFSGKCPDIMCSCGRARLYECKACNGFTQKDPVEHSQSICSVVQTLEKLKESGIDLKKFSSENFPPDKMCPHTGNTAYECKMCKEIIQTVPAVEHSQGVCSPKGGGKSNKSEFDIKFSDEKPPLRNLCACSGEKFHECEICKRKFVQKCTYLRHLLTHTGEKPHECETCGNTFTRRSNLSGHLGASVRRRSHECELCEMKFFERRDLSSHMLTHTGERPHVCEICKKAFARKVNLITHLNIHVGVTPYGCEICKKRFSHKKGLSLHLLTHTGERPHECGMCGKKFTQRGHLSEHYRTHTGERPYECEMCPRKFSHKGARARHVVRAHSVHKCETCGQKFPQRASLAKHVRSHVEVKPYKCESCKKTFSLQATLLRHMLIHARGESFTCKVCGKKLARQRGLTEHMRMHTGEKPYECTMCKKSFSHQNSFLNHVLIHGEKTQECTICGKKFVYKSQLTSHLIKHGKIDPHMCKMCGKTFSLKHHLLRHIRCTHSKESGGSPNVGLNGNLKHTTKMEIKCKMELGVK